MTWDLVHHGVEVTVTELDGSPKFDAGGCVMDPLDNTRYNISYKGREYAQCHSTISVEGSKNEIPSFRPL